MTCLRALGPEADGDCLCAATSRRPTDGRYGSGENPNRLQHYYQFRVVGKPSPENIQGCISVLWKELVWTRPFTISRFVEDNWETRRWALGTRLGSVAEWHGSDAVHLLPTGRRQVKPVTGEITYGLERLAMYIGAWTAFTTRSGRYGPLGKPPTATCSIRTKWSSPPITLNTPMWISCSPASGSMKKPSSCWHWKPLPLPFLTYSESRP